MRRTAKPEAMPHMMAAKPKRSVPKQADIRRTSGGGQPANRGTNLNKSTVMRYAGSTGMNRQAVGIRKGR